MFWAFFYTVLALWLRQAAERANLRRDTNLAFNQFCPPPRKTSYTTLKSELLQITQPPTLKKTETHPTVIRRNTAKINFMLPKKFTFDPLTQLASRSFQIKKFSGISFEKPVFLTGELKTDHNVGKQSTSKRDRKLPMMFWHAQEL